MASTALFKKCVTCAKKMSRMDNHDECVHCLGETHSVSQCSICQGFTPKARSDRSARLKAALWKNVLLAKNILLQTDCSSALAKSAPTSEPICLERSSRPASVISVKSMSISVLTPTLSQSLDAPGCSDSSEPVPKKAKSKDERKSQKASSSEPKRKRYSSADRRWLSKCRTPSPAPSLPLRPISEDERATVPVPAPSVPSSGSIVSTPSQVSVQLPSMQTQFPLVPTQFPSVQTQFAPIPSVPSQFPLVPTQFSSGPSVQMNMSVPLQQPLITPQGRGQQPYGTWNPMQYPAPYVQPWGHTMPSHPAPRYGTFEAPTDDWSQLHPSGSNPSSELDDEAHSLASPRKLSDTSPDNMLDPDPAFPLEDSRLFNEQMLRMAQALDLPTSTCEIKSKDKVFDKLYSDTPQLVAFPLLDKIKELLAGLWAKPASLPSSSRKLDNMYRIQNEGCQYLFQHPPPGSLMVEESQGCHRSSSHTSPSDREGRKLEGMGRKIFASTSLNLCISNYQSIMSAYLIFLLEKFAPIMDSLPENKKSVATMLHSEMLKVTKQHLNSAKHAAETAGRAMAGALMVRRHAWLRASALPFDSRCRVEDLPFEGSTLFSTTTDKVLLQINKTKRAARVSGVSQPAYQHSQRFPQHYTSYTTGFQRLSPPFSESRLQLYTQYPAQSARRNSFTKQKSASQSRA